MAIRLVDTYVSSFVNDQEYKLIQAQVTAAHNVLHAKSGAGNTFLGWMDLPRDYDKEEYSRICAAAKRIQGSCDVFIVIGIGGSYLGSRAVIEFLRSPL